jgi:hypothetical protein
MSQIFILTTVSTKIRSACLSMRYASLNEQTQIRQTACCNLTQSEMNQRGRDLRSALDRIGMFTQKPMFTSP